VIKWTEKTVKVKDLKPYERNPRRISEDAYARLKKSLQDNGYHQRILATKDLRIVGGHQRIRALKELGLKEIAVLVPDKNLTDEEFRRLLVQDNLPFGNWDFDILSADFEIQELIDFGMPEEWLGLGEETGPEEDAGATAEEEDDARIVHCPKCNHEFSILTEKKSGKK
jgi:ParB-like chromosome segregation protein Spo0J